MQKQQNRLKNNKPNTYAFIDSQNLNLGVQRMGWKMDWRRFRQYLKDKYGVTKAYTFIGYMSENEQLYEYMHELGYLVVLKPTVGIGPSHSQESKDKQEKPNKEEKTTVKGNVDAELVLYALKEIHEYDKAIIVSGDGDFYSLIEYLDNNNKLAKVMVPNWQYSGLLKNYESQIVRIDKLKRQLSYKEKVKKSGDRKYS
jgi:uncharacterized LabA/DUF88 family protein